MINELAAELYQISKDKGFHSGEPKMGEFIANLHAETSELWEAYRENKLYQPCDKAKTMQEKLGESLNCMEEELADIVIRALDTAHTYQIDMDRAIRVKSGYNKTREFRHGNKLA